MDMGNHTGHENDHGHDNQTHGHMDMHMMMMYFHTGSVSDILFKGWSAATGGGKFW